MTVGLFPTGPEQAAEMGLLESHKVQQIEMQSPSPGVEQSHVPGEAGERPGGKQPCRGGLRGPGGQV